MQTFLDARVLEDFFASIPQQVPFGNEVDINCWNTFWNFIKSETDLSIFDNGGLENLNALYALFLTSLTSGRGNSKFNLENNNKPNFNLIQHSNPHTFCCLNEESDEEQKKCRKNNGLLIAFKNDYKEQWSNLKLLNKPKLIPVRQKISSGTLSCWEDIESYILPFTDVIIVDSYIMAAESQIPYNLEKILCILDKYSSSDYNLTIFTFEGTPVSLEAGHANEILNQIKKRNRLRANISIVVTGRRFKPHDRGIFMNYVRIKTGDSFNYFNSTGKITTSGTELDFYTMADPNTFESTKVIFDNLKQSINMLNQYEKSQRTRGNLKNRLLKGS